jgi:hypothetical protein
MMLATDSTYSDGAQVRVERTEFNFSQVGIIDLGSRVLGSSS